MNDKLKGLTIILKNKNYHLNNNENEKEFSYDPKQSILSLPWDFDMKKLLVAIIKSN